MKDKRVIPRSHASASVLASGTEANGYFEWFQCRTATKLPGTFLSRFWDTLLFQASLDEPAVLHAVLALSSVHKRGVLYANTQPKIDNVPNEQEQYTLNHYVGAIGYLQPHFLTKDRASIRVALITCVTFVSLELLRGHFNTAQTHLQNGLRILEEMQMFSGGNDGTLRLKSCLGSTDDWILEAFSRLHLQVELLKHAYQHPCLLVQATCPATLAFVFHSMKEAWQQMGRLLNKIFRLTHQSRQQAVCEHESLGDRILLFEDQQRIRTELARWLEMYEAFEKAMRGHSSAEEEKGYQLLYTYHTMTRIMVDTCLRPSEELAFDLHTDRFVLLIMQLTDLRTIASMTFPGKALPGDMSSSIIDMGWIPPLYFAVVKCRVHRIRLQAIKLLESSTHREGFWDSRTAACVARKVMETEERDFYKDIDTADDFSLPSSPSPQDLSLPALPESYRIRDVEVVLSSEPLDRILLFCKQEQEGVDCRVLLSEYNVHLRCWIDGGPG